MRYLGNKTKLLTFIENIIEKYQITGETFADLFAGTGSVGDYFKDRYTICSNDFMYYSFVFNKAKLLNAVKPDFQRFNERYKSDIFVWLNNLSFLPNDHRFIYRNYTPIGNRMFFTEENGLAIDGIRIKIEELYRDQILSDKEYFYILASLLESVTKVSNTSGTYEAFFKFWESRASKKFILEPLEIKEVASISAENRIYNTETNNLARHIEGDIVYIDTPYSVTQYASAYHILETIARYDFPEIKGVGGKRNKGKNISLYSRKQLVKDQFEDLFRQLSFKHILISYSNQGLLPIEELVELAQLFAVNGIVNIEEVNYKEYQNHRTSKKSNGQKLNEVILYFKKDISINKSPLNYSGSKDSILKSIIREFPQHIGTFVDVMGGAFNVGANVVAIDEVIYNEINPHVYNIIDWHLKTDKNVIIESVEDIINIYNLEKKGKIGYEKLREYYNLKNSTSLILYILHMYSFQNMIRFNSSKKFNTPVGVAGYSNDIKERIQKFIPKTKNTKLINSCYSTLNWSSFKLDTVFYFDPPYFITSAAYNDGKRGAEGWNADHEAELLNTITKIHNLGYKFILSNVLIHQNKTNNLLLEWIQEHNFFLINIGPSGWRYSKDEIIVKNFN